MSELTASTVLAFVGGLIFATVLVVRRLRPGLRHVETGPASAVLSYVAAAFGILIGFLIVFLLGEATGARHATGDEATSIGTAFDEAQLFPASEPDLQHALICYSRSVTEREWPALAERRSAPEADEAYRLLIAAYGAADEPTGATFQAAAATNSFVQIGGISTARETRLVAAESHVGPLLWAVLVGAALLVLGLLSVVSMRASPVAQAALVCSAGVFTSVLLLLVVALNHPFHEGSRLLSPRPIEETTVRMEALAPEAARLPCAFEEEPG